MQGTITVWKDRERGTGFGFIESDHVRLGSVYFAEGELVGEYRPKPGDRVAFSVNRGATNVKKHAILVTPLAENETNSGHGPR